MPILIPEADASAGRGFAAWYPGPGDHLPPPGHAPGSCGGL